MGLGNGETYRTFNRLLALQTDECILWPHGRTAQGYGKMTLPGGPPVGVHVQALVQTEGSRPSSNHDAAHDCRNRHCMNPRHLRWATRSSNSLDRHRDGTCTQAKLSVDDVYEVRRLADTRSMKQADIAERFGVSVSTIEYIKARKLWAHLPEEEAHGA